MGPEMKFSDSNVVCPSNLNDTYTLLNTMTQGTDYNQMIGRRARIVHISLVGTWEALDILNPVTGLPTPATIPATHCRTTVVFDRQTDGLPIVYTDVFQAGVSSSPQEVNTKNRFVILYDHHTYATSANGFALGVGGANDVAFVSRVDSAFVNFQHKCSLDLVKRGVTSAVADIESGSIWVLLHSDTTISGTAISLTFRGYARVLYQDN